MTSAVFLTAAALILSGAAYQAIKLLSQRASRPAVTWFALGLALALRAPVIATPINNTAHVPHLNVLAGNSLTLIAVCGLLTALGYVTEPAGRRGHRKSRLRLGVLAGALSCLTGLFVWSLAASSADFLEYRSVQSLAYVLIYVSYLAAGMTNACRLCMRYFPHISGRYLRLGLGLIALGSALGILYCAAYGFNTVATFTQLAQLGLPIVTLTLLPSIACVLVVIGATIGGWGPCLSKGRERLADYRSYRKLGPLWRALAEVAPEAILAQGMTRMTIGQKRYRRIIEIQDMLLILRPYRGPTLATDVAATSGESSLAVAATAEAMVIDRAIRARREGRLPAGGSDAMPAQLGTGLAAESDWLEAVSAALTTVVTTPTVRMAIASPKDVSRGLR
ncbi:MAG: MAB_1171c family putative transporter [Pseudonocardiaceae bacterium]